MNGKVFTRKECRDMVRGRASKPKLSFKLRAQLAERINAQKLRKAFGNTPFAVTDDQSGE